MNLRHYLNVVIACALIVAFDSYCGTAAEEGTRVVARVFGKDVTAQDIGLTADFYKDTSAGESASCAMPDPVEKLKRLIWNKVGLDYVNRNGLKATEQEINEYGEHLDASMKQNRERRKVKLAEIEEKLESASLTAEERKKLEKRRETLVSLAQHDAKRKLSTLTTQQKKQMKGLIYAEFIENWKLNKAIYEKYGGIVAITKFGPDPVGAKKEVLKDYEKQGNFVILDEKLRKKFWEYCGQTPKHVYPPGEVDFTPHWKKPIKERNN